MMLKVRTTKKRVNRIGEFFVLRCSGGEKRVNQVETENPMGEVRKKAWKLHKKTGSTEREKSL